MDWTFQRLFPVTELLEESKRIMRLLPVRGCYVPPDPATPGKSGSRGQCEVDRGLGSVKAPGHPPGGRRISTSFTCFLSLFAQALGGCGMKSRPEAAKLQPPCSRWLTFLWLSCLSQQLARTPFAHSPLHLSRFSK